MRQKNICLQRQKLSCFIVRMIEEFEGDLLVSVLQLLSRIISMEQYTCYINIRFFSPSFRFKSPPKNDRFRATLLLLFTSVSANCKLCCGSDLAKKNADPYPTFKKARCQVYQLLQKRATCPQERSNCQQGTRGTDK